MKGWKFVDINYNYVKEEALLEIGKVMAAIWKVAYYGIFDANCLLKISDDMWAPTF